MRVRLTKAGRRLREWAGEPNASVAAATGLAPDEFARLQRGIVALRDSLVDAASSGE